MDQTLNMTVTFSPYFSLDSVPKSQHLAELLIEARLSREAMRRVLYFVV
jgi:hypothetical protein